MSKQVMNRTPKNMSNGVIVFFIGVFPFLPRLKAIFYERISAVNARSTRAAGRTVALIAAPGMAKVYTAPHADFYDIRFGHPNEGRI
jgi:hypothetical protein